MERKGFWGDDCIMKRKWFLKVLSLSFCLIISLILAYALPAYTYLGSIPITQQITAVQNTPFNSSTFNASSYQNLTTLYSTQASTYANPFANYASQSMTYRDVFSQASAQTMSYNNIFGVSLQQGQGFYADPFYTTGGKYLNYTSLAGGVAFDQGFTQTALGGTTHVSGGFSTPWTTFATSIDVATGMSIVPTIMGAMPASSSLIDVQHVAYGTPTVFNLLEANPAAAGQLAVHAYSHETAAMNQYLSQNLMYTEEGMPFYANASYYNPNSLGGSNWYFPGGASSTETATQTVGGVTTGYVVGQETTGGYYPGYYGYSGGYAPAGGAYGGSFGVVSGAGGGYVSGTGTTYGGTNAWL